MSSSPRIAIVGAAGVFAGAPTLDHLWRNICSGTDASCDIPQEHWSVPVCDIYDPVPGRPDKISSLRGYVVTDWQCNPAGLDLPDGLLSKLDPLFHLTLKTARAAWRDAVTNSLDRHRVATIFGNLVLPTVAAAAFADTVLGCMIEDSIFGNATPKLTNLEPLNRKSAGLPAQLLARALGLGGLAMNLDAACASSLFALKLACDELTSGRADAVLAGGVCRPSCLYTQVGFSQLRALSASGRSAPFDVAADGLLVGEGAGFFVLKRTQDALEHGDTIHAIIAGIGLSNDTRGNLLAPDQEGQLRAMRGAYEQAEWHPDDVDLIECHATGTPVGDPVELSSLSELWKDRPWHPGQCVVGSVKANVGHTLTAAGAAGLLKVLLALRQRRLPPVANVTRPRGEINNQRSAFRLLTEAAAWNQRGPGVPRRAAVSAFGFGGINAHVLIEEWLPTRNGAYVASDIVPSDHKSPIAVVGVSAKIGSTPTEEVVSHRLWGLEKSGLSEAHRFDNLAVKLRLMDDLRIDPSEFRMPPRDLEEMLPQQLVMLQVAVEAVTKSGWSRKLALRTGVFIGLGLDANATNFQLRWSLAEFARHWSEKRSLNLIIPELERWLQAARDCVGPPMNAGWALGSLASITASRIARVLGIGGPSFVVCNDGVAGLAALHIAGEHLRRGELDAAIVGAVDLPGDARELVARALEGNLDSTPICDGAIALVLRRQQDAIREGQEVRFVVDTLPVHDTGGPVHGLLPLIEAAGVRAHSAPARRVPKSTSTALKKQLQVRLGHPPMSFPPLSEHCLNSRDGDSISSHPCSAPDSLPLTERTPAMDSRSGVAYVQSLSTTRTGVAEAHAAYLRLSERALQSLNRLGSLYAQHALPGELSRQPVIPAAQPRSVFLDRAQCLEYAMGSIARVLGPGFAEVDAFPTRVRLPAEPLMLVDRVLSIGGETGSLGAGTIVTEHDIRPDAWYVENGRVITCVALEAGQADLLLSGYLGADKQTRGLAMYRLLDATVAFHRELPHPGQTLHYEIAIDHFFRQGNTHLFRFRYEASVDGMPLLTMTDGCAGFFTPAQLAAGKGIVPREKSPSTPSRAAVEWCVPFEVEARSLGEAQLAALVDGDLVGCFGTHFARLRLHQPLTLPNGLLQLLHRVAWLDVNGGSHGLGIIRAEQDIDPSAWFLTCHFIDDPVMPGTLMLEVCLQAFRILLLQLGWLAESTDAHFEPVPGVTARLRCRGQVTAAVRTVAYEVTVKRIGHEPSAFAVADALVYADGRPIVEITDLSLRLTGVDRTYLEQLWS